MAIKEENISFTGATAPILRGLLAFPEGPGSFPAIVVIHEAFGLNDNIKSITRRFAEQGYAALGVDLFAGRNMVVCMARFFGGILFNSLDHGGIRDLKASLDYLAARPNVDNGRLGAIGFCMGGSFAIAWACTDNRLKAIAPYYGMNPRPQEALNRLCPIVGSYPEQDFTAKAGKTLETKLEQAKIPHDIKIYPDTHHSFFNDQRGSYDPAAAEDSWTRVLSFFKQYIG